VGELQPTIPTEGGFLGLPPPFGFGTHCPTHCRPRVAQGFRGIRTCPSPHLPPAYAGSPPIVQPAQMSRLSKWARGSRSLPDLTGHLTARAGDGHAPPLSSSGKVFSLTFILLSPLVRFSALTPIEPQPPPLVVLPRQFL
jgi:hypothetical protein